MNPRSLLSALRRQTLCSLYARTVPWGKRGPVVSIGFDDFPRTAYLAGGAILKNLGVRGTYYAAPGLMGASNELGEQFCPEDIHSLLQDGHELACHTFGHISSRGVSCSQYRDDVERGRKAMEKVAGTPDSGNFAYPFGHVTLKTKKTLGPRMSSSRSIFPGLNGPDVDLNLLRANSLYGGVDQFEKARHLILENEKRNGWLIFYSHDVRSKPSPYGCTPSLLESTATFALQHGCRILTVKSVLEELGARCV
jgi:peptidoglycan/xylan/chitin deacetylase (PgdA/CDA1 family)